MSFKAVTPAQFRTLSFDDAAQHWLEIKKLHTRKPRTMEMYEWYIRNLSKVFGGLLLSQIHIGHVLEYQQQRRQGAGPSCVNHEINTLSQILKYADLWDLIQKHYRPLPLPNWTPPKVLTAEEEERFFRVVAERPDWSVAYWAVSLTNNTSAMGIELRHLQSGTPDETIISIAGHQSIRMSRYYSRIRISAKAEALRAICPAQGSTASV
ncbi:MAG TPA: hypothetical protein VFP59_13965 [Candidatus Angelobacter sp.]|nr:hypothetical protein [Candidatus Angelobacter sp.]